MGIPYRIAPCVFLEVTGFAGSLVSINNVTGDGLKGAAAIDPPKLPEPVK
jgi:hypothetical protein